MIVLCHDTAIEYWRLYPREEHDALPQRKAALLTNSKIDAELDTRRLSALGLTAPYHVLYSSNSEQITSSQYRQHVRSDAVLKNSLLYATKDIAVSSPEMALLQMAWGADSISLLLLICEFCGSYFGNSPRTSISKIDTFILHNKSVRGATKLEKLLKYAADNSRSQMETALFLLLSLPPRLGGYGIPKPILNYKIPLGKKAKGIYPHNYCQGDLCWPNYKLCVEYDSDQFHTGKEKIDEDARRRSALSEHGYDVVVATSKQVFRLDGMDSLAKLISKRLDYRIRTRSKNYQSLKAELRKSVLENQKQKNGQKTG